MQALSLVWCAPFEGLLLSIAVVPLFAPSFWHRRHGKVATAWTLALLVPFAVVFGTDEASQRIAHAIHLEYVPFLAVLFALFTIAGGICARGAFPGTPRFNTGLLALGGILASFMETTGASMLLTRLLLTANELRPHRAHAVVSFILLVGIGGGLSPLPGPAALYRLPQRRRLRLDHARASDTNAVPGVLDWMLYRTEPHLTRDASVGKRLALEGTSNFVLLGGVIGAMLLSGLWESGVRISVIGSPPELEDLVRDALLVLLALASLKLTRAARGSTTSSIGRRSWKWRKSSRRSP